MVHFAQCPSVRAFALQIFEDQLLAPMQVAGIRNLFLAHSEEGARKFGMFCFGAWENWTLAKHGQLHSSLPVPPDFFRHRFRHCSILHARVASLVRSVIG